MQESLLFWILQAFSTVTLALILFIMGSARNRFERFDERLRHVEIGLGKLLNGK